MAKKYSPEYIAKKYGVSKSRIEQWSKSKYGEVTTEIPGADNTEIAIYLGRQPISLKIQVQSSSAKLKKPTKKLKPTMKLSLFRGYVYKIQNKPYREMAQISYKSLSDELQQNEKENKNLIKELGDAYMSLPKKVDFRENHCEVKHFTWQDIEFNKEGYRINPNKIVYSNRIDGPTKILENLHVDHFIENHKTPLFKAFVNKCSGKVIEELSPDLEIISEAIRDHIATKITASGVHKKPISSEQETHLRELTPAGRQYIQDHFSSNPYILWLSKIMLDKGFATALWENNNDTSEECILFVTKNQKYTYAIWENIKTDRACYVFKYQGTHKDTDNKVGKLLDFINGSRLNKRHKLFHRELDHENIFESINYFTLTHNDVESYRKRIYEVLSHLK